MQHWNDHRAWHELLRWGRIYLCSVGLGGTESTGSGLCRNARPTLSKKITRGLCRNARQFQSLKLTSGLWRNADFRVGLVGMWVSVTCDSFRRPGTTLSASARPVAKSSGCCTESGSPVCAATPDNANMSFNSWEVKKDDVTFVSHTCLCHNARPGG